VKYEAQTKGEEGLLELGSIRAIARKKILGPAWKGGGEVPEIFFSGREVSEIIATLTEGPFKKRVGELREVKEE